MLFRPALLVVDFQQDFCPPNGSLAVPDGRAITNTVNDLLDLPFALKIATMDWHPANHKSFASNHKDCTPYVSTTRITNPHNTAESYTTRLWPTHCVQQTPGAELVPEMRSEKFDHIIHKGTVAEVEMYSAFYDPFENPRVSDSGLANHLRERSITHVYVVGLAADYCVKATAIDAQKEGFTTYIVDEGTKPVDSKAWPQIRNQLCKDGISVVSVNGPEVAKLRS
ncbi:Nicotinamidase [Ceratocystis fimbriata CBS 114723]|uniref:nicotinamidase n=1 Tax=Ceratocystis fimbriata CBS 114723 TaxID=1035309 RepID=A0A2C5X9I6_9PEZI|nr:Nicotinamidase [Ceratocystis fimbriata CBS 114723]